MHGMDAKVVHRLAEKLNRTERLIVSLHYADGLTLAEIAAVLERTEDEIARSIGAIVERVRAALTSSGRLRGERTMA